MGKCQVSAFPTQPFDQRDSQGMVGHVEYDLGRWRVDRFRAIHHMLTQRMRETIEEATRLLAIILCAARP